MKSKIKFLPFLLLALIIQPFTFSATLQLTKIGALDTGGMMYTEWWYTGVNPTLAGKAVASSTVTVDVGETDYSATANSAGDWSVGTSLKAGDYNIVITQGSESYTFTLHLGQNLPSGVSGTGETSQSTSTVPETGFNQMVALSFGSGIALLASYLYISSDANKKTAFEKKILQED